ncbi:hypothetical protein [Candidatus Nitrosacidococcus sp. I8]|uniref:hypothetical protein n=1 Tax=Candidatus Nitrosacidococcus sp. I8 TaxID=2942908 RepID=UPI002227F050|nr:hypothetical protein [Candidatus Nitrosacidococcus sp. I8]CAH9019797.1 hypothetical protein NURINAE_01749 [Candidatus Nitrosacidococcus sp. I8]
MKKFLQLIVFILVASVYSTHTWAEGNNQSQGADYENLSCLTKDKNYVIHFTAYQPAAAEEGKSKSLAFQHYCQDLPEIGATYISIDLLDEYARKKPIMLRIVEIDQGKKEGKLSEKRTLITVPEKTYAAGFIEAQTVFDEKGVYAAILTIDGEDISIPMRVGMKESFSKEKKVGIMIAILFVIGLVGYLFYRSKSKNNGVKV